MFISSKCSPFTKSNMCNMCIKNMCIFKTLMTFDSLSHSTLFLVWRGYSPHHHLLPHDQSSIIRLCHNKLTSSICSWRLWDEVVAADEGSKETWLVNCQHFLTSQIPSEVLIRLENKNTQKHSDTQVYTPLIGHLLLQCWGGCFLPFRVHKVTDLKCI